MQYHAGDDIIMSFNSIDKAEDTLTRLIASRNGFNPRKQSCGESGEFLRLAVGRKGAYGYLNRSISSVVCGSWVNSMKLVETHMPGIYQRAAWTLDNRALGVLGSEALLSYSMHKRSKIDYATCKAICGHRAAADGGPVISGQHTVTVLQPRTRVEISDKPIVNSYASGDYVATVAERIGPSMPPEIVSGVKSIFARASHLKSMTTGYVVDSFKRRVYDVSSSVSHVTTSMLRGINKGVLARHPTLPSLANLLNKNELQMLVRILTGKTYTAGMTVKEWLFGSETWVVMCKLGNAFDDMAQFARRRLITDSRLIPVIVTGINVWT
jgi:hypothetical protein